MATINSVNNTLSSQTGTGSFVGSVAPSIRSPVIQDTNGVNALTVTTAASAVNYITIGNRATGLYPFFLAVGADADIGIQMNSKAAGVFEAVTTSNTGLRMITGTGYQHTTSFVFANTLQGRTATFPDADLTVTGTAAAMTNGQLPIGNTGNLPTAATLTAGTGISVTNAAGAITIAVTGGGFAVATIAGTTQNAAVNTMYIALNAAQTTVTLPGTCAVGETVILIGASANVGGWILDAPAGDTITYNGSTTSSGGTITSSALAGQTIEVVCDVANTSWIVVDTVNTILTTA